MRIPKLLLVCVIVLVVTALIQPALAWGQASHDVSTEISGSIAVHGCEVDPAELLVRARPAVNASQLREIRHASRQSQVVRTASSDTPGEFGFRFYKLAPNTPYRLGVKLLGRSAARCGKTVWNASQDPLVVAGQEAVTFDAYTVSSQIELWGEAGSNRTEPGWFGADIIDLGDAAKGTRQIRWRSDIPGVTGGRLQVSARPFPKFNQRGYNPCSNGEGDGVIHQIDFDAAPGAWTTIAVDFHALLGGGRSSGSGDTRTDPGLIDGPPDGLLPVSELDLAALNAGRPVHVRVLPRVNRVVLCDPDRGGVPPEVVLAKLLQSIDEKPAGEPVFSVERIYYNASYVDPKHPKPGEICYRVTNTHKVTGHWDAFLKTIVYDTWDYALVLNSSVEFGGTANAGFRFCIPDSYWESDDDGWFESFVNTFGSVLTAIVDAAGKLVNSLSALWEEVQDAAVDAAAAGLSAIPGVNCDNICRAALEMGLEVGLASMGVPPSLPNFDQLVDQGADYLAAQAGSQIGVPSVLTDYASGEAQKFIKKAVKNMKDRNYSIKGLPDWLVPDIRFEPAFLALELYRTGDPLPSQPGIVRANDPIFAGKFVQLPKLLPKKENICLPGLGCFTRPPLVFPMVLEPNLYGLPSAPASKTEYEAAIWDKEWWMVKRYAYGTGCYHLFLVGLAPLGDHVFNLVDYAFKTALDKTGGVVACQP